MAKPPGRRAKHRARRDVRPVHSPGWALRRSEVWLALLLVVATLVAFSPALRGGLLWDDAAHITRPDLQSAAGLWRIWFDLGATQQYYPVLHSAFWLEHRLWGDNTLGYHLLNVALHATSALLVIVIVRTLRLPGAIFAGFVFALHPVGVETVAWMTEQKNTLSTVFYLASALAYLRFEESRGLRPYVTASALFVLAVLSKSVTATLPAALLVVLWWSRGRLEWRRDVLPLAPWLIFAVVAGLTTAAIERDFIGAQGPEFQLGFLARCLLAGRVLWFYLWSNVWPFDLMFSYPRWQVDPSVWWWYLFSAGAAVMLVVAWGVRRRSRGPLAALLLFAGTLVPVLGFLNVYPFVFSYVADHFQYIARLAIIVPAASVLTSAVGGRFRSLAHAAAVVIVAILGVTTWTESATYRDAETLYRETIARNPESAMAHHNLAVVLAARPGHLSEAIEEFRIAERLKPDFVPVHRDLALALWRAGRPADAIREYETALRLKPDSAPDHLYAATLLADQGRMSEAAKHARAAIALKPDSAPAHLVLADALAAMGDAGAVAEYRTALRLDPSVPEAHANLATLLAASPGLQDEAVSEYEAALRLKPDSVAAHYNLGTLLMDVPGRTEEGIRHLQTAVRLQPTNAAAHQNLGVALSSFADRKQEAILELENALRLDPSLQGARELLMRLQSR